MMLLLQLIMLIEAICRTVTASVMQVVLICVVIKSKYVYFVKNVHFNIKK